MPWTNENYADPAIGEQASSTRPSSAKYSFGRSASRVQRKKGGDILVDTQADFFGKESPGCVYELPTTLNVKAGIVFGTEGRKEYKQSYPPTSADLLGIIPDFNSMRYKIPRRHNFGTEHARCTKNAAAMKHSQAELYARDTPGCVYEPDDTMVRPQSAPNWTMRAKQQIIIGAKQEAKGSDKIGPGTYKIPVAIGKQFVSNRKSAMASSFSKAPRFKPSRRAGDAAGMNTQPPTGMGKQVSSAFRTQPIPRISPCGREKFAKSGCMITPQDQGERIAKLKQVPRLHHVPVPNEIECRRWGG